MKTKNCRCISFLDNLDNLYNLYSASIFLFGQLEQFIQCIHISFWTIRTIYTVHPYFFLDSLNSLCSQPYFFLDNLNSLYSATIFLFGQFEQFMQSTIFLFGQFEQFIQCNHISFWTIWTVYTVQPYFFLVNLNSLYSATIFLLENLISSYSATIFLFGQFEQFMQCNHIFFCNKYNYKL